MDASAAKGLLNVTSLEQLRPLFGAVSRYVRVLLSRAYGTPASKVANGLLQGGTIGLACITATSSGIAKFKYLAWYNEHHDMGDPAS